MINVIAIEKTCPACPAQWEGWTDDHRKIYVRYRWEGLSISIGKQGDADKYAAVNGEEIFYKDIDTGITGTMTYDELKRCTELLKINWPENEINNYEDETI